LLPWNQHIWNTPAVAHDNPGEHRRHGSVILTFVEGGALLPEPQP
jgi:hypothetical protein